MSKKTPKKVSKKTPKLNPRQAMVIKKIAEGKSATRAYSEVYDAKGQVASVNASQLLSKPNVQNALQRALRKQGVDEESIGETLLELKSNRDWRAKESYIKTSAKFLGYKSEPDTNFQFAAKNMKVEFIEDES